LFLSRLSRDNTAPDLVYELFHRYRGDTEIVIAGRYTETAVYEIGGNPIPMLENITNVKETRTSRAISG